MTPAGRFFFRLREDGATLAVRIDFDTREALFQEPTLARAEAFLSVFDREWQKGEQAAKQALVPDAILAALLEQI